MSGPTQDAAAPVRILTGTAYVAGEAAGPVMASDVALSFWGGVDPRTGRVIDSHHPLHGRCLADQVLAIPGGRGSCSGSAVMLELLLNGMAPKAMLFEREEDILTLGVIVAEVMFGASIPVVTLAPEAFRIASSAAYVSIDGNAVLCNDVARPMRRMAPPLAAQEEPRREVELSALDRAVLEGERGAAAQCAMRIITRMARLQGAPRLFDITQVHVDGCVYTGPGCLAFAERLLAWGGRVMVPTTLNAISVDAMRWRGQGVNHAVGEPAARLGEVYAAMGARPTYTCAPYVLDMAPKAGDQIAWAESNAVVYANSVLGARTMKYPDFLDICVALTGRAPWTGAHLEANRKAALCVKVPYAADVDDSFYPLLGYEVGKRAMDRIPLVIGLQRARPSNDDLKAFGAAFATLSSAPMFHILGVTPEAASVEGLVPDGRAVPSIDLGWSDLASAWDVFNSAEDCWIDLVSLGNPHFTITELERLAGLCRGRVKHGAVAMVVTCGRDTHDMADASGLVEELERFGVRFVTDTCWCMIAEPIISPGSTVIMTNSGKYAHYGPGLTGRAFRFGSLADCVNVACDGRWLRQRPAWLQL